MEEKEINIIVKKDDDLTSERIYVQIGHDNIEDPEMDSYVDYTIYDEKGNEIDGGQMDFNSDKENYDTTSDAIPDLMKFIGYDLSKIKIIVLEEY